MRTNQKKATSRNIPARYAGEKRRTRTPEKIGYAVYRSIDDFLRANPIAATNRYGERVISGTRIC